MCENIPSTRMQTLAFPAHGCRHWHSKHTDADTGLEASGAPLIVRNEPTVVCKCKLVPQQRLWVATLCSAGCRHNEVERDDGLVMHVGRLPCLVCGGGCRHDLSCRCILCHSLEHLVRQCDWLHKAIPTEMPVLCITLQKHHSTWCCTVSMRLAGAQYVSVQARYGLLLHAPPQELPIA